MNEQEDFTESNREAWDRRAGLHLSSDFYDVASFKEGRCSLNSIELDLLGEIRDKELLHLQCHFGQDTLSLARRGAKVTGIDFSTESIAIARQLRQDLGLTAEFECCDVLELDLGRQFDVVYTSYGVLTWLEDLERWADRVVRHLRPGGELVLVEFHPTLLMYDFDSRKLAYDYFRRHYREQVQGSYAVNDSEQTHIEHFWTFSLSDVLTALLSHELTVLEFQEYDYSPYGCFSGMVEEETGRWRWQSGVRFPHLFAMRMGYKVDNVLSYPPES